MTSALKAYPLQSIELNLSSAELLDLNSNPVVVLPPAGAGKFYNIVSVMGSVNFATTPYATNTTLALSNGGAEFATDTNLMIAAQDEIWNFEMFPEMMLENAGVEVRTLVGDATAGDSDITLYVLYRVIEL